MDSGNIRRLVVIQPHGIGDLIMTMPMLSGIKRRMPDLHVTVVAGSIEMAEVIKKSRICDKVLVYNSSKARLQDKLQIVLRLRQIAPDACLVVPQVSSYKGELISWLTGARWRVGCQRTLPWIGYNLSNRNALQVHKVEAHLLLAKQLFPEANLGPMFFNIDTAARDKGDELWQTMGFGAAPVLGIHPGCDPINLYKRYPVAKFKQIIEQFLEVHPEAYCLIFLGPKEEKIWGEMGLSGPRCRVAKGNTLQVTARLLERARVLLANDSGLGHVANALNTRVVSIVGPTDPAITAPWGAHNVVVKLPKTLECQPCYNTPDYENCKHRSCLYLLTVEQVLEKVESVWEKAITLTP